MMRFISVVLFLGILLQGMTQGIDTVEFKGVTIEFKRIEPMIGKTIQLDSVLYSANTLGQVLQENTAFHIKNYGNGQLATATFRGTTAQHTQIQFNGVSISNPLLGMSDLSTIPTALFNEVSIHAGGNSVINGAGGIGGIIQIGRNYKEAMSIQVSVNSMQSLEHSLKWNSIHKKWKFNTSYQMLENNNAFSYIDYTQASLPKTIRTNNQLAQQSVAQSIGYQIKKNWILETHGLYSQSQRNNTGTLLSNSYAQQTDQLQLIQIRSVITHAKAKTTILLHQHNQSLDYSELNTNGIYRSTNRQFAFKLEKKILKKARLEWNLDIQKTEASSTGFAEIKSRNGILNAVHFFAPLKNFHLEGVVRQDIIDNKTTPTLGSIAIQKPLKRKRNLYFKLNRNYRLPSLNDLYWEVGGNPNLLPEQALQAELGFHTKSMELTAFSHEVSNWIQWQPTTNSNWAAHNIKNVRVFGLELIKNHRFKGFQLQHQTALTRSIDLENNNQLIYTPFFTWNGRLAKTYKKFHFILDHQVTGRRFLTSNNDSYMPWFQTTNLRVSKILKSKKEHHKFEVAIRNLFNQSYQVVAWYPMPLRNVQLTYNYIIR